MTVNILAHDRCDAVRVTVHKVLTELDYPADRLELIVVDNASTDGTGAMLTRNFPQVRLIENENVGAAGWNLGFAAGNGDWFLILDDDCYLEGDALRRAVEVAQAEEADLVSFRIVSSEDPSFEFNSHYEVGLLSYWGCAALVSRRAITALGGYDPNIFIWANELDLAMRLLDAGFRHLFLPEVTAVHMKPPPGDLAPAAHATHTGNLAYVVTKLLRPRDAVPVLASVLSKLLLGLLRIPSRWRALPALVRGIARGLEHRAPVGPAASSLYRRNFRDFAPPGFYLRHVLTAGRGAGGLTEALRERHRDFHDQRRDLYPLRRASLRLPTSLESERPSS